MKIIRHAILATIGNSGAIFAVDHFMAEKFVVVGGFMAFVTLGATLGILNAILKPILKLVSLPFVVITMGLFLIAINMLILWILVWIFQGPLSSLGFDVQIATGVLPMLLAALALSACNCVTHWLIR